MSKKHFIALARTLRALPPVSGEGMTAAARRGVEEWQKTLLLSLAEFCEAQSPRFNRSRWLDYIAGKCGPNGGKVAAATKGGN